MQHKISTSSKYSGILEVHDINGKLIWSRQLPQWSTMQQISLPKSINPGIYLVSIKSGYYFTIQKLVIYDN
ncbi:MAG: T9SS type A sorting domain-containing protein [Bacteroidetes bacterium]|nr:T9SS type A sorting domain-containing protein [Bacteroidota bacterium]